MILPIIHLSALEYWLDGTDKNDYAVQRLATKLPRHFEFSINNQLASELMKEYHLSRPIHLLVPDTKNRRSNQTFHLYPYPQGSLPDSFVELTDHLGETILVSSPEACFLYAAATLPFHEVVRIGCMLCAMYVSDNNEPMLQRSRNPITTVKKILRFLKKADNAYGIKTARQAIRYVIDNCNSPMEVSLVVLSCLPISRGGYALEKPAMNGEIKLMTVATIKMNIQKCHCDMVWEDHKTVLEYESNLTHLDKSQHEYDKKRSSAITLSGYQIINLTSGQLSSFWKTDETFFMIRRVLGMRKYTKIFQQYEDLRWEVVHEILLKKKTLHQILGIGMQGNS